MAATHTTVAITSTYTQLNSAAASGSLSVYPIDCSIWLTVSASTTVPTNDLGAIKLSQGSTGAAIINQTLTALFPGATSPAYLFARVDGISGGSVAVSCA